MTPTILLARRARKLGMLAGCLLLLARGAVAADFSRTVVAGGSITEIVYALGAQAHLVAVDSTSVYPPAASDLPDVGYLRQLSAEPILAMNPTLLLMDPDAGPDVTLEQLRAAGVDVLTAPQANTARGVMEKIRFVARAIGRVDAGRRLISELQSSLDAVSAALEDAQSTPPVLFLLSVGRGAPMVAGSQTSAQAIIELAGARNAVTGFADYKPASTEAIAVSGAEFILVTERTAQTLGGVDRILARPEIAATPAGRDGKIIVMNGLLLLGFGPRVDQAVSQLAARLHGIDTPAR